MAFMRDTATVSVGRNRTGRLASRSHCVCIGLGQWGGRLSRGWALEFEGCTSCLLFDWSRDRHSRGRGSQDLSSS